MSNHRQPVRAAILQLLLVVCAVLWVRPAEAIVGGYEPPTVSTEFDAVCTMARQGSDNTFCSGTLVAPNLVLIARHCLTVCGACPCEASTDPGGFPWKVRFRRMLDGTIGHYDVNVKRAILDDSNCGSDTALLLLEEPVEHIAYIAVDFDFLPAVNTAVYAAGWGRDENGNFGTLRVAEVVIGQSSGKDVGLFPDCVREHDSGGPVLWRDPCGALRVVATHVSSTSSLSTGQMSGLRSEIGDTPGPGCTFPSAALSYGADIRTAGTHAARTLFENPEDPDFVDHDPVSLSEVFDPEVNDGVFYQERSVARGAGLSSPLPATVSCGETVALAVYGSTTLAATGSPAELSLSFSSASQHTNLVERDPECELSFFSQTVYGTYGADGQIATPFAVSGQTRPWVMTAWYTREYDHPQGSSLRVIAEIVVDANHNGIAETGESRIGVAQIPDTSTALTSIPAGRGSRIVSLPPGDYVLLAKVLDRAEPSFFIGPASPSVNESMWSRNDAGVTLKPW